VQLVQPTTGAYDSNSRSGCYAPLGLVSMATCVRREHPAASVEILDGELLSAAQIEARLDADVVGINANTVTYPQALDVARAAKARGACVVLGGVFPSAVPELVLRHRADVVDTVVVGYGERPLLAVLGGHRARVLVEHAPPFDLVPFPDRGLVDLEAYLARFEQRHPTWRRRGTNLFTNVGCTWRDASEGGCVFCSRSGARAAYRDPAEVWREVRVLVERHGVEYLVDFSDTSLQNREWFAALVAARPADLSPRWHIFARIDEIDREALALARRLPCDHVFVGVESGDDERYRQARKGGGSPAQALAAARLLASEGIGITPSYALGLPGEDERSLARTLEHARRLHEITGFEEIFCCPLIPFPGSLAFERLRACRRIDSDLLDVEELKAMWAEEFCAVDVPTLAAYAERILALGRYQITIARGVHAGAPPARSDAGSERRGEAVGERFTCV
jgi:radical SAM superfamily enzyme YgiQ (UPF0313 family)